MKRLYAMFALFAFAAALSAASMDCGDCCKQGAPCCQHCDHKV